MQHVSHGLQSLRHRPELVDRESLQPVRVLAAAEAGIGHNTGDERLAEDVTKSSEPSEVATRNPGRSFDLEANDGAIAALNDQVELVALDGSPVPEARDPVHPGSALHRLTDHEGLQEVSELRERSGVTPNELLGSQPLEPGGHP